MVRGKNKAPALSIIIPFYNNHPHLPDCLKSIAKTVTASYEIIIADDGSPNRRFLKTIREPKIKILYLKGQQGPSKARNEAVNHATGKYLLFLDSDDTIVADPTELINRSETHPNGKNADILVGQEADTPFAAAIAKQTPFVGNLETEPRLARIHYFFALLYRREFLKENSISFQTSLTSGGDLAFLAQTLGKARTIFVETYGFYSYRRRENSITFSKLTTEYVKCRLLLINLTASHLASFPKANLLRSFGTFDTNMYMAKRATLELGRDTGLWFVKGLSIWARENLADDALISKCLNEFYVPWTEQNSTILKVMRDGGSPETILKMILTTLEE